MPIIPDFNFEKSLLPQNARFILGIDEVGRGPWAGPVVVGAFLLDIQNFDHNFFIKNKIRDSKLLSESQRQAIFAEFQNHHFQYQTFSASSEDIDKQGIGVAIKELISQAVNFFDFDLAIVDGNYSLNISNTISVVKADQRCFSVASASIVAKVVRDQVMDQLDLEYPVYGFKAHKGYGTKQHSIALNLHGPCPIHRRSYQPIKKLLTK